MFTHDLAPAGSDTSADVAGLDAAVNLRCPLRGGEHGGSWAPAPVPCPRDGSEDDGDTDDKPAVATFGPNFRILLGVPRGTVMPEEQAAAGGGHWRLDAGGCHWRLDAGS